MLCPAYEKNRLYVRHKKTSKSCIPRKVQLGIEFPFRFIVRTLGTIKLSHNITMLLYILGSTSVTDVQIWLYVRHVRPSHFLYSLIFT